MEPAIPRIERKCEPNVGLSIAFGRKKLFPLMFMLPSNRSRPSYPSLVSCKRDVLSLQIINLDKILARIGIHHLEVAVSGLDNLELTFLERFCAVVGLKTEGKFKKATSTHLICPSKSGEKYEQALLWNKPVVDLDWVYNLGYPKPEAVAHTTADTCMMDVTNGEPLLSAK